MEKEKILLIIPAYNEEDSILKTCNKVFDYNKKNKKNYDIVVINDGSTDKTEKVLIENRINHICLINNLGIGGAVQTGYKYAFEKDYDYAIQFDGDGQHNVEYIEKLLEPLRNEEASMTIGSRFIKKIDTFRSSMARRCGIKLISFFIKIVTYKKIYDTTSGMRAINKELIRKFAYNYPTEYPEPVSTTLVLKENYIVKEVSVQMNEREAGVSSIKAWKDVYYMINVLLSILVTGIGRNK